MCMCGVRACVCTCVLQCVHACMQLCEGVYAFVHACSGVCVFGLCVQECEHADMFMGDMCACVRVCVQACVYTHACILCVAYEHGTT